MFLSLMVCVAPALAMTESFSVSPNQQKTFDITINTNQKIFFQIFVSGGDDSIRLKIIDNNSNFEYFNSIIRAEKQNVGYDAIMHPAYKNEISNNNIDAKNLTFIFDNLLSTTDEKKISFTYSVLTQSVVFEDSQLWSWISTFLTIVIVIAIVIVVIIVILKKMKGRLA